MFRKPEAISRAPICNGISRFENVPTRPPVRTKEDHDGSVNGHQCQIRIAIQYATGSPLAKECLQDCKALSWPAQAASGRIPIALQLQYPSQCGHQELLGDHLVIVREDVLRDEALFVMMCVCSHDYSDAVTL